MTHNGGHWRKNFQEMSEWTKWVSREKTFQTETLARAPARLVTDECLTFSRDSREASVAGAEWARGRTVDEMTSAEGRGRKALRSL